jgi:hypothetical protein
MCLDELSFGGMLKRCGLLRGGRHCGGRDGVTPLMFAARTELTLHRTNRFGNSSRFERRSSAAYADVLGCRRQCTRASRRVGKPSSEQDMIQPGPGSRSPAQKRTLPVQRSIRRTAGRSRTQ